MQDTYVMLCELDKPRLVSTLSSIRNNKLERH